MGNYFAPVVLCKEDFTSEIIIELHTGPLGGHLLRAMLLEKVWEKIFLYKIAMISSSILGNVFYIKSSATVYNIPLANYSCFYQLFDILMR